MNKILIQNGLVINSEDQQVKDILIQDGQISSIDNHIHPPPGVQLIDASDKWIFPGIIDPHTHMGIPIKSGFSADNFESGSRSALHGGVTTILDFTVLEAGQTLRQSLEDRLALARTASCDVGIHVNITRFEPELLAEIPGLIAAGYTSFKTFTTYADAHMMFTYAQIEAVAEVIASHGGILMVHSEDDEVIVNASKAYLDSGETHPRFHGLSRPAEAELTAIGHLGEISENTGCTIYIVHLNTAAGLLKASEYENLRVETCPHYLLFNEKQYEGPDGQMYVSSPPLRTPEDQKALWHGLQQGLIDTLGSDHCPFCRRDKPPGLGFQDIPNGMGGVETLFPTMLAQFIERGMDLSLLVRLTSSNPAQIFGLSHLKGHLAMGMDADMVIVDPQASVTGWETHLDTILDWNGYTGHPALFPELVIHRGEIAYERNVFKQGKRSGQLLKSR